MTVVTESWSIAVKTVHCGGYFPNGETGCGAEIGYLGDAPSVCAICGGRQFQPGGSYGLLGIGGEPPSAPWQRCSFDPGWRTRREIVQTLCVRRRLLAVDDAHREIISAALAEMILAWKDPRAHAESLFPHSYISDAIISTGGFIE